MEIRTENLNYSYGKDIALKNINITIPDKSLTLILGHNGGGKTTFVKCLLGELSVKENNIFLNEKDLKEFNDFKSIGYIPQFVDICGFPVTTYEFLNCFSKKGQEIDIVLKNLKIEDLKYKNINELSGGQRKKVYIARAIINNIDLLILDEPLAAVDEDSRGEIIATLGSLNKARGITVLIITHNFNELKHISNYVLHLEKEVKFFGEIGDYLEKEIK